MMHLIVWFFLASFVLRSNSMAKPCDANYKVYVYELPQHLLKNAEDARSNRTYHVCKKCIYEQFALEYIISDYFTQFCGRTNNPDEADYFYLPIVRDIDYRIALATGGGRAPSIIETALIDAIEGNNLATWRNVFNVTDKYWLRHNGADHLLVMPAPVTNLRHQSNMRGFFHYMIQLNRPIFLNVEFSRSFVAEYPVCALEKNIVVPYPTTDSDFYSGRLFLPKYPDIKRDKLVFYQGGHHGSCEAVRSALVNIIKQKQLALYWGEKRREAGFQSAAFCPIPVGDSPSSKRMYDVINFGCIPVVLSDDLLWAYTTEAPTNSSSNDSLFQPHLHINVSRFSIHLPQSIVQKSATFLLQHSVKGDQDVNFGQPLPVSGLSLYALLKQVAEEERLELFQSSGGTVDSGGVGKNNTRVQRRKLSDHSEVMSTKLFVDGEGRLSRRFLTTITANTATAAAAPVAKQVKKKPTPKAKPQPAVDSTVTSVNALVRLLQKIPQEDIRQLQREVMRHAEYYRYYSFNRSLPAEAPPLTALHTFPDGGALRQLDRMLALRKQKGIVTISELCQIERNKKHAYIGRYPCEKRRI